MLLSWTSILFIKIDFKPMSANSLAFVADIPKGSIYQPVTGAIPNSLRTIKCPNYIFDIISE